MKDKHQVIKSLSNIFPTQAPIANSEYHKEIVSMLDGKSSKVLELVYQTLKSRDKMHFPKPFEWEKAISHASVVCGNTDSYQGDLFDRVNVNGVFVSKMDVEVSEHIKSAMQMDFTKEAIKEGWFGNLWPSYSTTPYGLINYLSNIYRKQIYVINEIDRGMKISNIPEFSPEEMVEYTKRLNTPALVEKIKQNGYVKLDLFNKEDYQKLRERGLARVKTIINSAKEGFLDDFAKKISTY